MYLFVETLYRKHYSLQLIHLLPRIPAIWIPFVGIKQALHVRHVFVGVLTHDFIQGVDSTKPNRNKIIPAPFYGPLVSVRGQTPLRDFGAGRFRLAALPRDCARPPRPLPRVYLQSGQGFSWTRRWKGPPQRDGCCKLRGGLGTVSRPRAARLT